MFLWLAFNGCLNTVVMVTKTWVLMLDVIVVLQLDDGPIYHIMLHYDSAQRVGQQLSSNRLASRSATVGVTVGA